MITSYPHELHNSHNDYPLTPIHKTVLDDELSPDSLMLWQTFNPGSKRIPTPKLIPTLENKQNHILHYETLKLYLELGMRLDRIHKIIEYDKSPWLKPYIDFNARKDR